MKIYRRPTSPAAILARKTPVASDTVVDMAAGKLNVVDLVFALFTGPVRGMSQQQDVRLLASRLYLAVICVLELAVDVIAKTPEASQSRSSFHPIRYRHARCH
jgi:hypothetical protein